MSGTGRAKSAPIPRHRSRPECADAGLGMTPASGASQRRQPAAGARQQHVGRAAGRGRGADKGRRGAWASTFDSGTWEVADRAVTMEAAPRCARGSESHLRTISIRSRQIQDHLQLLREITWRAIYPGRSHCIIAWCCLWAARQLPPGSSPSDPTSGRSSKRALRAGQNPDGGLESVPQLVSPSSRARVNCCRPIRPATVYLRRPWLRLVLEETAMPRRGRAGCDRGLSLVGAQSARGTGGAVDSQGRRASGSRRSFETSAAIHLPSSNVGPGS